MDHQEIVNDHLQIPAYNDTMEIHLVILIFNDLQEDLVAIRMCNDPQEVQMLANHLVIPVFKDHRVIAVPDNHQEDHQGIQMIDQIIPIKIVEGDIDLPFLFSPSPLIFLNKNLILTFIVENNSCHFRFTVIGL